MSAEPQPKIVETESDQPAIGESIEPTVIGIMEAREPVEVADISDKVETPGDNEDAAAAETPEITVVVEVADKDASAEAIEGAEPVPVGEDEPEDGKSSGLIGHLKSPIGLAAMGGAVALIAVVIAIFVLGLVPGFGSKKADPATADADYASADVSDQSTEKPVDPADYAEDPYASDDTHIEFEDAQKFTEQAEQPVAPSIPVYGDISDSASGAVYHTSPTTVTLQRGGAEKQLTLSMGILADRATAERLKEEGLTVSLLKIEAAQSVDYGPFLEWEIPGLITKDLKARLEREFPDLEIRAIMIRDFQF